MEFIIDRKKRPKLKSPVVIEGLPGIGNVARIVTDFLIDKMKAKKFLTINSPMFPNSVLLNEDSTVDLPKIEMYYTKNPDLIIIIGDAQPGDDKDSYKMSEKILDILSEFKPKSIVTIGGIGLSSEPKTPKVYGAVSDDKLIPELEKFGVIFNGAKTVGIIIGATGLLLGLSKLKGMNAVSLLVQTFGDPTYFGFRASKQVLEILRKYLDLKFSLEDIDKEIKNIEEKKIKRMKRMPAMEQQEFQGTRYIG